MPLGKRTDFGDARYAGLDVPFASRIEDVLGSAMMCGFDFIVAPLADPSRRPSPPSPSPSGTLTPPFLPHQVMHTMSSVQISNQIVGKISSWIDLDATDVHHRLASTTAFHQELAWASHLTAQACLLPPPPHGTRCPNYARAIDHAIVAGTSGASLWILIPATTSSTPPPPPSKGPLEDLSLSTREASESGGGDPWEWWNVVRFACNHSSKLGVVLEVGADLPEDGCLNRWWGEPLKAISLRTDSFLTNRKGYPALSKRHQDFLAKAFYHNVQIILSGDSHHPPPVAGDASDTVTTNKGDLNGLTETTSSFLSSSLGYPSLTESTTAPPLPPPPPSHSHPSEPSPNHHHHPLRVYWEYLSFLFRKQAAAGDEQSALEAGYRDLLQAPLQPLQDNLESQTYETFERDATKYNVYGEAVRQALLDRVPPDKADTTVTVLMVVGAGRGPLVTASLAAARAAGRRLRVWAVEKNPNAVVHLNARAALENWHDVTIIHADMRDWKAPEQADILVSELLGSFGDNELSPECLDGAQRFLRSNGVSIPQAYTSFLQPITAHKLWTDVNAYDDVEHFETPFVVKFHRFCALAPSQPLFTFSHPNKDPMLDNSRSDTLTYTCTQPVGTVCHGFAGYFDAQLYKEVHLSILPETHTPSMFSWFPIFFPLRQPFYVPAGAEIRLSMWRCCSRLKVHYEWAVGAPVVSPIHNSNGRSYFVGL